MRLAPPEKIGAVITPLLQEMLLPCGVFTARRLATDADLRRAYSLVRMSDSAQAPVFWLKRARRNVRSRPDQTGLVALGDSSKVLHAVFRYSVRPPAPGISGTTLRVDEIVTAQLPGSSVLSSLIACANRLGTEFRCSSVSLDVSVLTEPRSSAEEPLLQALQAAGFHTASVLMVCRQPS